MTVDEHPGPLKGIRVLEIGQLIAGPFAGSMLAYFGADVIKVEPPSGDPLRNWRILDESGTSYWWRSMARNKRCITVDLRTEQGRELVARLAEKVDVLLENFRPGTMETWGLGPTELAQRNPKLIYARVSGFGQTGSYRRKPGYASVCEALGGLRYITGYPGDVPVRSNISLGDSLCGLHAVIGVVLALYARASANSTTLNEGQVVDVSIIESVMNMLEGAISEYDATGIVREPSGTTVSGIVPSGTYRCRDGRNVVIGANSDSMYRKLMNLVGRNDLATNPACKNNSGRIEHQTEIDDAIARWVSQHDYANVVEHVSAAEIPIGAINTVADLVADPHVAERHILESIYVGNQPLRMMRMPPILSKTPGKTRWAGRSLGADNHSVFSQLLGLSTDDIEKLKTEHVI